MSTLSSVSATARQYDACNPSVVQANVRPPSKLWPKPTAAAATTSDGSSGEARIWWVSSSTGMTSSHSSDATVPRHTPPTCTFTSAAPSAVTVIDRVSGGPPHGGYHPLRIGGAADDSAGEGAGPAPLAASGVGVERLEGEGGGPSPPDRGRVGLGRPAEAARLDGGDALRRQRQRYDGGRVVDADQPPVVEHRPPAGHPRDVALQ